MKKKEIIVANRVFDIDGEEHDAPDAPVVFKAVRNDDGTWTATVPDE